jgi:DNA repair protein RecO (recombination protein O)
MQEEKTEGIVLRSRDFKERHRIITLFTAHGLVNLIVKNISRKNTRLLSLTTPFSHGEYLYLRAHSELLRFQDGTLLDDHSHLRQSYSLLQTAGALANAILTSQLPDKPSPALFSLYKSYHKQVAHFPDPAPLLASFYLKLLKHDGLLSLTPFCTLCENTPASLFYNGEGLCTQHPTPEALRFSSTEWETLLFLDQVPQFSLLRTHSVSPSCLQKIHTLFLSRLSL